MSEDSEYRLLDSGDGRKLEQVGPFILERSAANAFWPRSLPEKDWSAAHGVHSRDSGGGGSWRWRGGKPPESWVVQQGGLRLLVKPTDFGHLGFFAEQSENWEWLAATVNNLKKPVKVLNLFAYSGGASLAMAKAGAMVTHLDAAKGMINWGRDNLKLNPDAPENIRWIVDDVFKFVAREIRRKNRYQGIVLDPPSFGRGAQGQVWKIEERITDLLESCRRLVDPRKPFFILFSCHSPGFTPSTLERLLLDFFPEGKNKVESDEMTIPEASGKLLSAGAFARITP